MQFVTSLHRSDCFRLERQLPGGIRTRWDTAPFHGAHQYRAKVDALLDMGMRVEEHRLADYARAVELQSAYGLLTIDSVILATALRVHADHLVTTDTGFRGIDEFSVVIIDDVDIPKEDRPAADTRRSRAVRAVPVLDSLAAHVRRFRG